MNVLGWIRDIKWYFCLESSSFRCCQFVQCSIRRDVNQKIDTLMKRSLRWVSLFIICEILVISSVYIAMRFNWEQQVWLLSLSRCDSGGISMSHDQIEIKLIFQDIKLSVKSQRYQFELKHFLLNSPKTKWLTWNTSRCLTGQKNHKWVTQLRSFSFESKCEMIHI